VNTLELPRRVIAVGTGIIGVEHAYDRGVFNACRAELKPFHVYLQFSDNRFIIRGAPRGGFSFRLYRLAVPMVSTIHMQEIMLAATSVVAIEHPELFDPVPEIAPQTRRLYDNWIKRIGATKGTSR
jgi:hypothetical protein